MHRLDRALLPRVLELLKNFPAVAILGPRQCGKTTLAHEIQAHWPQKTKYMDLEKRSDVAKLDDCVGYLEPLEDTLIILDEVQTRPGLFSEIRGLIDSGRRKGIQNGRFLFLSSASYELLHQSGESLAGRIAYLELPPFRANEVKTVDLDLLWNRGGFPDSFLASTDDISMDWRAQFMETYLARDLNLLEKVGPLPAMKDLMQMTAHLHGQVLNVSQLVKSHEFSRASINHYLDLFEQTFIIRRLPPFLINVGKRITKRPKMYIRDSGLLHQLHGIDNDDTLRGHPMRGVSWEGFVIEQIISYLPGWDPYFYRTSNGAELDLVMVRGMRRLAFEIKVSTAPTLSKGFYFAKDDVAAEQAWVVSKTNETWETAKGVIYTHLADLENVLSEIN